MHSISIKRCCCCCCCASCALTPETVYAPVTANDEAPHVFSDAQQTASDLRGCRLLGATRQPSHATSSLQPHELLPESAGCRTTSFCAQQSIETCGCRCEALWQAAQDIPPEQRASLLAQLLAAQIPASAPCTPPQGTQAQPASSGSAEASSASADPAAHRHSSPFRPPDFGAAGSTSAAAGSGSSADVQHPRGPAEPSAGASIPNGVLPHAQSSKPRDLHTASQHKSDQDDHLSRARAQQQPQDQANAPASSGRAPEQAGTSAQQQQQGEGPRLAARSNLTANRDAAAEAGRRSLAALQTGNLSLAVRFWSQAAYDLGPLSSRLQDVLK